MVFELAIAGATLTAVVRSCLRFSRWRIERKYEREQEFLRDPRLEAIQEKRRLLERQRDEWRLLGVGDVHKVVESIDARLMDLVDEEQRVDSGGLQEEAAAFGVPVLVARDTTERTEGVDAGVARLIGRTEEGLVRGVKRLMDDHDAFNAMARPTDAYGDGKASERIAADLCARARLREASE